MTSGDRRPGVHVAATVIHTTPPMEARALESEARNVTGNSRMLVGQRAEKKRIRIDLRCRIYVCSISILSILTKLRMQLSSPPIDKASLHFFTLVLYIIYFINYLIKCCYICIFINIFYVYY